MTSAFKDTPSMIGTVSKYSCGVNSESGLTSDLKIRALTHIAAGLASYAKDFCLSCLLCKRFLLVLPLMQKIYACHASYAKDL